MATEVVSIIDPDAGSGYDYDSLYDWEAAEQGDLTGARDEIAAPKCRCTGGTADSTAVTIDGWTTSATQYIKIWTDPAESYRHAGKYVGSGNVYRLVVASQYGNVIKFLELYGTIDGLIIKNTHADGHQAILYEPGAAYTASLLKILNCVVVGGTRANTGKGIDQVDGRLLMVNSIIYGANQYGFGTNYSSNGPPVANVYNCVSCSNGTNGFIVRNESAASIVNCYSGNNGSDDYSGKARTTCASEDATGSTGLTSIAFSVSAGAYFANVTAGSEDFSIGASSALIGAGTNLYNDANYPFQDDIIGTDRGGSGASWDIGAFEYVASGGETYSETATDGFKSGEALARISTFRNVITDGFSGGESMARRADMVSLSADGAKIGEFLARILTLGQTASDGIILSEQLINSASLSLAATDGAALSDSAARRLDLSATIADGCKLSEVLATVLFLSTAVADGAKFSETITTDLSGILEEIISDGFKAGDSPSSLAQFIRAVADRFNLSETVAAILRAAIIATDGIKTVDSTSAVGTFARTTSDAIVLTDATAGDIITGIIQAIVADGFRFSETTATVAQFDITVTDGAKFSETIATIMSMLSAIAEGLSLGDAATITTETVLASGRVTITFTGRACGKIVFTVRKPSITFTVN